MQTYATVTSITGLKKLQTQGECAFMKKATEVEDT